MCGVFGMVSGSSNGFMKDEIEAMQNLMYMSALRGVDSTGLMYGTDNYDVQIYKDVLSSSRFLETDEWKKTDQELYRHGTFLVGHCRAATRGAKTEENAHPFVVDDRIVLVHNGTMFGDHKKHADVDVDSHAIAHLLAENEDPVEALRKVNGAYALIWYNVPKKTLYLIRNQHRPLAIMREKYGHRIAFASEIVMLQSAMWRNKLGLQADTVFDPLPEHHLMSIQFDNLYNPKITVQKVDCEYKTPVVIVSPAPTPVTPIIPINTPAANTEPRKPFWPYPTTGGVSSPKIERKTIQQAFVELDLDPYKPVLTPDSDGVLRSDPLEWKKWFPFSSSVIVESETYTSAYHNDPDNKNWYVFGKIIAPDQNLDGFNVMWEITAEKEEDVMEYVANTKQPMFKGKVDFTFAHQIPQSTNQIAVVKIHSVKRIENVINDITQVQ